MPFLPAPFLIQDWRVPPPQRRDPQFGAEATRSWTLPCTPKCFTICTLLLGAAEERGEPVAGAGCECHWDRRGEQGVAAGAGNQQRSEFQQVDGQGVRDWPAVPARLGYVPPVHGDLEGCRGGHDGERDRPVGDRDQVTAVGVGRCGKEPAGTV